MNETQVTSILSTENVSAPNNGTGIVGKIYVFRPIDPSVKLAMLLALVTIGIIAFVGNVLILLFLRTKDTANSFLRTCSFQMNFNFYVKSLAISDVLSSVISIPIISLRLYIDVLERGLGCKVGRYLVLLFPCITINNLLVISFGKYLSTRQVPRVLNHSTVKRIVLFAWLAGFLVALFPAATFEGIRYDVNDTHYMVLCRFNNQHLPFRITFVSCTVLQYIIPSCILVRINVSLIITLWTRTRRSIDVQRNNGIRLMVRAVKIRSISTVVTITFAFVTPYIFYIGNVIYQMVAQPEIEFETDYVIRSVSIIIALSNSAINVVIYLLQMKGFRTFVKNKFIKTLFTHNQTTEVGVAGIEMHPQGGNP